MQHPQQRHLLPQQAQPKSQQIARVAAAAVVAEEIARIVYHAEHGLKQRQAVP
jgi:hypothetical protein